jgi:TRAP-type C4-dicarboxylate transport system permease small subunit
MATAEQQDAPLVKTHERLYKIGKAISCVGMAMAVLMMLMVVLDVLLRFALNKPILGSVELASYMLSIIAFTAIPLAESEERHVVIPVFFDRLPRKVRLYVYVFVSVLGAAFVVLIGLGSFSLAFEYMDRGKVTQVLGIPLYPFVFIAALCISLYAIVLIVNAVKYIDQNR